MKNILVLMHDDPGQEARFQAALDLTRALDGHLTCVDIAIEPTFVGDYADVSGAALLMTDEEQRERSNRTRMEARLKIEDVPYDWIDECGFVSPCVRAAAALADVIVLNRELTHGGYPDMIRLVGDVLMKSPKPIVAVPEKAKGFNALGPAVVAWDGSAQADAALRAAVPLLQKACSVTLLEVRDGSVKVPAEQAAEYLSRYGVTSLIRRETSAIDLPSTILLDTIDAIHAAYVVMGGFGHGRLLEAALGGVTRRMLKESRVPLFLAH